MDDPTDATARSWTGSPTAKEKNAVQKAVTALLDELAPERVLKRADRIPVPIEQYRTPSGCVLQAATAAVTVSWFGEADSESVLGELHVIVWHGQVTRRGAPRRSEGATILSELVLHPVERPASEGLWRSADGREFDTAALAAYCATLLEEQMRTE
jgi:hypothetical protein